MFVLTSRSMRDKIEFNRMVSDLNEKEVIEATFGRHVGQQAAREILARECAVDP